MLVAVYSYNVYNILMPIYEVTLNIHQGGKEVGVGTGWGMACGCLCTVCCREPSVGTGELALFVS